LRIKILSAFTAILYSLTLVGCAAGFPKQGPTTPALIGDGKTQQQYDADDGACRQKAKDNTGVSPQEAQQSSQVENAFAGGVLGTIVGAALGSFWGDPGLGAGIGAVGGLGAGVGTGAYTGASAANEAQQRYNAEYKVCMYNHGHKVEGVAVSQRPAAAAPPPPPPPQDIQK
jgi:hypothetical protein